MTGGLWTGACRCTSAPCHRPWLRAFVSSQEGEVLEKQRGPQQRCLRGHAPKWTSWAIARHPQVLPFHLSMCDCVYVQTAKLCHEIATLPGDPQTPRTQNIGQVLGDGWLRGMLMMQAMPGMQRKKDHCICKNNNKSHAAKIAPIMAMHAMLARREHALVNSIISA